jgi:hypothetical protein
MAEHHQVESDGVPDLAPEGRSIGGAAKWLRAHQQRPAGTQLVGTRGEAGDGLEGGASRCRTHPALLLHDSAKAELQALIRERLERTIGADLGDEQVDAIAADIDRSGGGHAGGRPRLPSTR